MNEALIERVEAVRQQTGDSLDVFAVRISCTPERLTQALAGEREFTSLQLALVAEIGGKTIERLFNGTEPRRIVRR